MDKRGQFFFIAAIIVVAILLGFGVTYNQTLSIKSDTSVEILAEEMRYEVAQAIDYSIWKNIPLNETIENLSAVYARVHNDKEILVIYGSGEFINSTYYKYGVRQPREAYGLTPTTSSSDQINLSVDNGEHKYSFNLSRGQNIHIMVRKQRGGESFVAVL